MTVRVSVVVPTYRRPELLQRCLAALKAQNLDPECYEVIIADNGGSRETEQLVREWGVRYVAAGEAPGPAHARNAGWRAARGEVIAFTDDDCVPDPGWLKSGLAHFDQGVGAIWGRVIVPLPQPATDYECNEAQLETAEFATANCFCRRDVLAAVGGFDERFTAAWREDADLFFTLLDAGYKVRPAPDAVVVHPVRPARWGVSLRQQRKSQFNALLYQKHPARYRQKIQAAPPWHYYGTVAALVGIVGGGVTGQPWVALAAGSLWLVLTGRFCARRLAGTSHAPLHVAEMVVTSMLIPPLSVFWRLRGAIRFRVPFL